MKLGVMIEGQEGLNWERWKEIVRATEELGYESLWRSDHFFSLMGARDRDALETFVSLVHVAENTSRIRFGTLVCSMTFRHPALVARMAAGIDRLSGGRFILGIGAGWNVPEHEAFGIPFPPLKERMDILEDSAAIITGLWREPSFTFKGRVFELKDARLNPKPAQSPAPLLIGGGGERRTLRAVARYASEWNVTPMPIERYRQKVAALEGHCAAAGRDPSTIARSMMCGFIVGRDEAEALERVRALQQVMPMLAQTPAEQVLRGMAGRGWLAGTPEQVVVQIKALEAEGISRIMLQHHNQTDFDALELIAAEVMPRV
ncbi:MAG TPA: TIGR03560 family F420-dependent LLM class oxidoreductase [Dehalococcoidia bacterium]|nr:TIGR03560 family F420-dependent LLM class oxidoreductase [Dehalococcoidia bacterium]